MIHNHSSGKHRLLKKILAVCMVLAMICSVSISAFAVEASSEDTDEAMQSVMVEESDEQTVSETEAGNEQAPDGEQSEVTSPEEDAENPDSDNEEPALSEDNEQPEVISPEEDVENPDSDNEEPVPSEDDEQSADSTATDQPEEITVTPEQNASVTPSQEDAQNSDVLAMEGRDKWPTRPTPTPTPVPLSGKAAIYYLATPDGVPGSNDIQYWAPTSDKSALFGTIDVTNATWEKLPNGEDKNIVNGVSNYINAWPDGTTESTWTVKRTDSNVSVGGKTYFNYILDSIWTAYESNLKTKLGITDLKKEDVTEITLNPYKISRENSTTENQYYHIDCTIDITCAKVFTAKFYVKDPGKSDYTLVDAKSYLRDRNVEITDKAMIGDTKTVDGVTYVLDGWYPENDDGKAYGNNKILDSAWPYTPSDTELADSTVNFYAHYTPLYTSVRIKKLVTGSMGDRSKEFDFTVYVKKGNTDLKFKIEDTPHTGTANFPLTNDQTITLTEVPVGATVTVTEDDYKGNRYTTSWTVDGGNAGNNSDDGSAATATISNITKKDDGSAHEVVFTNHKDAIPDTGLTLGTTPYILALGIAAAGAVLLIFGRRKRQS